jgi:hypothetical protein
MNASSAHKAEKSEAFINLQLFIPFGRKAYELMAYFKREP